MGSRERDLLWRIPRFICSVALLETLVDPIRSDHMDPFELGLGTGGSRGNHREEVRGLVIDGRGEHCAVLLERALEGVAVVGRLLEGVGACHAEVGKGGHRVGVGGEDRLGLPGVLQPLGRDDGDAEPPGGGVLGGDVQRIGGEAGRGGHEVRDPGVEDLGEGACHQLDAVADELALGGGQPRGADESAVHQPGVDGVLAALGEGEALLQQGLEVREPDDEAPFPAVGLELLAAELAEDAHVVAPVAPQIVAQLAAQADDASGPAVVLGLGGTRIGGKGVGLDGESAGAFAVRRCNLRGELFGGRFGEGFRVTLGICIRRGSMIIFWCKI